MAKNIKRHITHIKSKVVEGGLPKLPAAADISEGEIAVNYAKGYETLSIKNESGDVVTFTPSINSRQGETIHYLTGTTGADGDTNLSASWSGNCSEISSLYTGLCVQIKIPSAGHSSGVTLSINGGEKHPILYNDAKLTTHYGVNCVKTMTYDADKSFTYYSGSSTAVTVQGVWRCDADYDSNTDNNGYYIGYKVHETHVTDAKSYRYMILLQKDETTMTPVNTKSNTTAGTKTLTTSEFDPFGTILYKSSTTTVESGDSFYSGTTWTQYPLNLAYSFNTTNTLTFPKAVYIVAVPQSNGKVKLDSSPISQTLPTSADGKVYIYLGQAYSATNIYLENNHPVYQYKNGQLRQYVGSFGTMAYADSSSYSSATEVNTALSGKSNTGHTHDDRYYTEAELTGSSTTVVVAKASSATTAASAAKLSNTSAVGSGTQPVFFTANGVPSATTYSLSKSVPSNAVFTDTAVTQTNTTANGSYEVMLAGSTSTATTTEGTNKNVGMAYNPSASALTVSKKITTVAANNFITGTGTAATTGTSGSDTVCYPAKWTFDKGITVADGDMFTIKIPVAGHSYGVYISLNNGTNYYPVVLNGTGILTTHYPVNTYITVVYESTGTAAKIYPVTGATSGSTGTSAAGVFRVVNYYDSNTTYSVVENTYLKYGQYKAATVIYRYQVLLQKDETSLLPINTVSNSTATTKTLTTEEFDPFGNIFFYNVTATTDANAIIPTGRTYQQVVADLRYSFNAGKTLTANKSVYMVCVPQANGKAKLHSSPISQTLPTTDDGLIYIYLGVGYNTYTIDLTINHPIYTYKNGKIRLYTGADSAAYNDIVYSAVTINANQSNVTCPSSITGGSKSGSQAVVIYKNSGNTTVWTITVSNSSGYVTPDGNQLTLYCRKGGYTEINYLNIGGTIYVRGV